MHLNNLTTLNKDELHLIHESSMNILNQIGIKIENPHIISVLLNSGCIEKDHFITFPYELIMDSINKVPKNFELFGINEENSVKIGINNQVFATQGSPSKIYDITSNKVRDSNLEDFIKFQRLITNLDNIDVSHLDVWPVDVPYDHVLRYTIKEWAKNSRKPFGSGCRGKQESIEMMQMGVKISGNEDTFIKYPKFMIFFNPQSPLELSNNLLEGLIEVTKYKQPVIVASAATAGMTAPITLAGVLTQTNAEVLAAITIIQLLQPGNPVLYGAINSPMHPNTLNVSWGAVETGILTIGSAQLAQYYEIPSRGAGAISSSNIPNDIQNGYERFMNLLLASTSGINYITAAGTFGSGEAFCPELLIIDNELIGIIKRMKRGIEVNDKTIAYNEIKKVAENPNKGFLKIGHTVRNTRKELYLPKISDRTKLSQWFDNPPMDILQIAADQIENILTRSTNIKYIDEKLEIELDNLIKSF